MLGLVLLAGIAAVMSNLVVAGDISASWQQYIDVLNIIKNEIFAYLALYTGITSASVFGATPALGGVSRGSHNVNRNESGCSNQ